MAESVARIRPYESSDEKIVRFVIGKAALEPLTVANRWGYVHPIILSAWFALSIAMAQYMKWWPSYGHGLLRWLSPLPAFASMAVPFMVGIDWLNRSSIEDHAQKILRQRDAADFATYYSGVPGSNLWMLEYGEKFIGLIAIDAKDEKEKEKEKSKKSSSKQAATEARIRQFYVDGPFRSTGIQDDMLAHAIRHTFKAAPNISTIKAEGNPLTSYVQKSLHAAGFVQGKVIGNIGLLKWEIHEMVLDRAQWKDVK